MLFGKFNIRTTLENFAICLNNKLYEDWTRNANLLKECRECSYLLSNTRISRENIQEEFANTNKKVRFDCISNFELFFFGFGF